MRNLTFTDIERLERADESEVTLHMDEDAFRGFYDRTSRSVWLYLSRISRDPGRVDDLLQETYYRFLRAPRLFESEAHRRNYLFRIATNLVRDGYRRRGVSIVQLPEDDESVVLGTPGDEGARAAGRTDLKRAMATLRPRDRALILLAYTQGSSHLEIAETLGLRKSSVKALLFRARGRLARLLRGESDARKVRS
jgi:RNA polymerase sigma-70 factor, ECF subfamily